MEKYQELLVSKPQAIGQLESTLKSLALFLPGKFKNSRFASQLMLCALKTISLANDSVLIRLVSSNKSAHTRYTQAWLKNYYYRKLAWLLTIIQTWEVAIEMLILKFSHKRSQTLPTFIIWIESIKTALRMSLLYITKRQVLGSVLPIRDYNLNTVQINQTWTGKRLKKEYPKVENVNPDDLFQKVVID